MMKNIKIDEPKNEREYLNEYQLMKYLKSNNISKERVELYRDFVVNLIHHIYTSYLGKEYIKTKDDVAGHFNWAFKKVLAEFEQEGIFFQDTSVLSAYFLDYFKSRLYNTESAPTMKSVLAFWDDIFLVKNIREKAQLNALMDTYKLFDNAFSGQKIILEKIL